MNVLLLNSLLFINLLFQTEFTYKASDLRKVYVTAAKDKNTHDRFAKHLADYKGDDVLVKAFQAGIVGMGAKYAWGPYAKLKHVRNSAHLFEEVIKKNPDNPEVRFLRYTIEYYVPRYLLMSSHLQDDKKVVLNCLFEYPNSKIDSEAFNIMREYFLKGNHSTDEEKKRLLHLKS